MKPALSSPPLILQVNRGNGIPSEKRCAAQQRLAPPEWGVTREQTQHRWVSFVRKLQPERRAKDEIGPGMDGEDRWHVLCNIFTRSDG
jgi:hypothetical protein